MEIRRVPKDKRFQLKGVAGGPDDRHAEVPIEEVLYRLELTISRPDTTGVHTYHVRVATPEALRATAESDQFVLADRATILVREFDWRAIRAHLVDIVARCEAAKPYDAFDRLRRYFEDAEESNES